MHPLEKMLIVILIVQLLHVWITSYTAINKYHRGMMIALALMIVWLIARIGFGFHEVAGII